MAGANDAVDRVLDKLIRDVEQAVHALYRGDVRQQTAKARTDGHRSAARKALQDLLAGAVAPTHGALPVASPIASPIGANFGARPPSPVHAGVGPADPFAARPSSVPGAAGLTPDEATAITKCVMAWLPMGPPNSVPPDSRCVPAAKELAPSWQIRELAREAIRRLALKV